MKYVTDPALIICDPLQSKGGASVTLEPGGQLELSGAPLDDLHATAEETRRHLEEVRSAPR